MARFSLILLALTIGCRVHADTLDQHFQKTEIQIGRAKVHAYIADTDEKRERGLMFVEKMKDDTGMLFVFNNEQPLAFWMKNTLIPLSIGYFDLGGKLIDIQEMSVLKSLMIRDADISVYKSKAPAIFALEMNPHWFSRHKIKIGAKLKLIAKSPSALLARLLARH